MKLRRKAANGASGRGHFIEYLGLGTFNEYYAEQIDI
jgi:hypothetical protein